MPEFRYVAITEAGQLTRGVMAAADEAAVIARLREAGHLPMRAEPASGRGRLADLLRLEIGRRGLSSREVAELTRELATMLGAGQDLDRALRFLIETASAARPRAALGRLRDAVRDGRSLAAGLAQQPNSFSPLYIGMVRAGEAGGALAPTLERLAVLLERQQSLIATIRAALVYPVLLLITALGSVVLLLTKVLPEFVPLFQENGAALPRSTQFLMDAGHFVSAYGAYLLGLLVLAALAARQALGRPGPRLLADRLRLRVPVLGALSREAMAARFTRTLGTLLVNGVPLLAALGIVRDALGNRAGVAAVERAAESVRDGKGLAEPLAAAGVFPARTISLLRLGEESAALGTVALRAAEIHEERTRLGVQKLVALLVPAITIVMGAAVAGIVGSLLQAMLSLNSLVQ